MNSRILTVLLALVLTPTTSALTLAQTNDAAERTIPVLGAQDWQGLRDLKPDKRIRVELKTGPVIDGKLVGLTGSTLTVYSDDEAYKVEQRDIQTVYRLGGVSRRITVRIGALVGLVAGSVIGGRRTARLERDPNRIPSDEDAGPLIGGIFLGTLGGTAAGALLGGPRKGKLLYESK